MGLAAEALLQAAAADGRRRGALCRACRDQPCRARPLRALGARVRGVPPEASASCEPPSLLQGPPPQTPPPTPAPPTAPLALPRALVAVRAQWPRALLPARPIDQGRRQVCGESKGAALVFRVAADEGAAEEVAPDSPSSQNPEHCVTCHRGRRECPSLLKTLQRK